MRRPPPSRPPTRRALVVAGTLGMLALAGCTSDDAGGGGDAGLQVRAAFYPLAWVAEEVGGDHVSVANLTRPGLEPHDLELTPRDVADLSEADLVVHLGGFQPAVDDAVASSDLDAFDAADHAALDRPAPEDDHGDEEAGDGEALDPHVWLDPTRLASVAVALGDAFAERDPDHAADYRANASAVVADLEALDAELADGLAVCANRTLVTGHEAFGYLAERYDLEQVGIAGISPDAEPSGQALAEITELVREREIRTIYVETLVRPDVAETVAAEAGVEVAVLDPIEGLTDDSQGTDYLEVMRSNLSTLQAGQPCP